MRNLMAISAAILAGTSAAQTLNFDSETEGFLGTSFDFSGVTVFAVNQNSGVNPDGSPYSPGDYGDQVVIEDANLLANDFADVTPDNVLSFGSSFVPGDNLSINLMSQVFISPNTAVDFFGVDLFHYENGPWGGIEVIVEGTNRGDVVVSESFVISDLGGRDSVVHTRVELSGASFDTVRIYSKNPDGSESVFATVMDNITFDAPSSCLADTNGDGILSPADFSAWVSAFNANAPECDQNNDGSCSPADFSAWVSNFNAGC